MGNDLNIAISAFAQHQIDLRYVYYPLPPSFLKNIIQLLKNGFFLFLIYSDVYSIPGDLRLILERCLSEEPSPEVLEMFMPQVRLVLFNLLKGLQNRQESWQMATQQQLPSFMSANSDE